MTEENPTIVIDVDVNGVEKIEKIEKSTKKLDRAQKELEKRNKELRKSYDAALGVITRIDKASGSLIQNLSKLAWGATPLFSAVSLAGMAFSALTEEVEKTMKALTEQTERFHEQIEVIAAAKASFQDLTETMVDNAAIMQKYGIQFDETLVGMTRSIAGLTGSQFAKNIQDNAQNLRISSHIRMFGGAEKYDAHLAEQGRKEAARIAFENAFESGKELFGKNYSPVGPKTPILSDASDFFERLFAGKDETQLTMEKVFQKAGYREGESSSEYISRRKSELELRLQRQEDELRAKGGPENGMLGRAEVSRLHQRIKETKAMLEVLEKGPGSNREPVTAAVQTVLSYLSNLGENTKVGEATPIAETKHAIERKKKEEALANQKKGKTEKVIPDGVWDYPSMGMPPTPASPENNIQITNNITISGMDPNNVPALTDAVTEKIADKFAAFIATGGSKFA